jgi:hypothetical protein
LELVRIIEDGGITVSGGEHDKDWLAGTDGGLAYEVVAGGGAANGLDGAVQAEQLGSCWL